MMKKTISMLFSLVMLLSMTLTVNVFAEDTNATKNADSTVAGYLNTYFSCFDKNYYFVTNFSKPTTFDKNSVVELTFSTTSEDEIEIGVAKYMSNKNKFIQIDCYSSTNAFTSEEAKTLSLDSVKIKKDSPVTYYFSKSSSEFYPTAGDLTLGVVLKDSTCLTADANVTVYISGVPMTINSASQSITYDTSNKKALGQFTHTFEAPVTFSKKSLGGFAKVLTAIKFDEEITADDVAEAVEAVADDTDNYSCAVNELAGKITDENIEKLASILDKANITVSKNEEFDVALPWASLATGTDGKDVTFAPIVKEGSKSENLPEGMNDSFALDIKLGANATEVITPIVKQKVVVGLPNGWDLSKDVKYKHDSSNWASAKIENGKAVFYTSSFSNFELAGTLAVADEGSITDTVTVVVKQDETDTNKFNISIKPANNKQIMNFAVGAFSVDIRNENITGNAMTSTAYKLAAADGLTITNTVDNSNDYVASFNFNVQVVDQGLLTAGVNGEIQIATLTLTGKGAFRMVIGGVDKYNTNSIENYIMMDKDDNKVNDAYAKIIKSDKTYSIVEKSYNLNFNIKYDLGISDKKDADYLDMVINITNKTTRETKKVMVGTKGTTYADAFLKLVTTGSGYDNESVATGYIELEGRTTYEYEIAAAGYRTFRGSVYLDEAKTINLWNTVYNAKQPVIQNDDRTENQKTVTFLVGDIWMDNKVDVYDLSAVTSYFGTKNIEAGDKYVAYDLDRDGDVDLRDIGYVQLTFGN